MTRLLSPALAAAMVVLALPAGADEDHMRMYHADPHYDQWFRSLKQADGKTSCCSLDDCERTEAEFKDGRWRAMVRGYWRDIPPGKIVQSPLSIDGEAYVCASPWSGQYAAGAIIFCFVPPIPGY